MIKRLFIIVIVALCANLKSFAQPQKVTTPDGKATIIVKNSDEHETRVTDEESEVQARIKHSLAFEVLGRELTQRERDNYGDSLSKEDLKNVLAGEQRLTIVRALITVEAEDSIKYVLDVYNISKLQTYSELIIFFSDLIEKYGSVKVGMDSEYVYNTKDAKEAFKKAASKAYETVFGVPEDKQNKDQIFNFLSQSNAFTYSKMIQSLMETITPDIKKQILFNALEEVGRSDLKTNDTFVNKLLEQRFTHANLMELFKGLKNTAPPQPAQGKNLQKK